MKQSLKLFLLLFTITLTLIACKAQNAIKKGDVASLQNQHISAYNYFKQALSYNPKLASNPQFQAKLTHARSRANFESGSRSLNQKNYPLAITQFNQALRDDPNYFDAQKLLGITKNEYAQVTYNHAIKTVDQSADLADARKLLNKALKLNPDHYAAEKALDSLSPQAQQSAQHVIIQKLQDEKQWQSLIKNADTILTTNPNLLLIRQKKVFANRAIDASNTAHNDARTFLTKKHIDNAIQTANISLEHFPFNTDAQQTLHQAKNIRQEADTFYKQALTQTQTHNYDQAIITLKQALSLFPQHPKAKAYAPAILNHAANHHTQNAAQYIDQNDLAKAQTAYKKALTYRSNHNPATQGLAKIYHTYAAHAQAKNLPGAALIWARKAHQLNPIHTYQLTITNATQQIYNDTQFNLSMNTTHANTITAKNAQTFNNTTQNHIRLIDKSYINLKAPIQDNPTFTINPHITALNTNTQRIASRKRFHSYNVSVKVPNPEINKLRTEIKSRQDNLAFTSQRFNIICRHCRGHHQIRCIHCQGSGFIIRQNYCSACSKFSCSNQNHRIHFRSHRTNCSRCKHGHNNCGHCHSTGRHYWRITQNHINNLAHQISILNNKLLRLPMTVPATESRSWPYTLETHQITAKIKGKLTIQTPDSPNAGSSDITQEESYKDNTIINDNPNIGLSPNPLNLPLSTDYLNTVNKTAAHNTAKKIINLVTTIRANQMLKISQTLSAGSQHIPAQEAAIAAALLYESSNPTKAKTIFRDIMQKDTPLIAPPTTQKVIEKPKSTPRKILSIT